jgi:hypothetical protein
MAFIHISMAMVVKMPALLPKNQIKGKNLFTFLQK